jgi:hypothetical protein
MARCAAAGRASAIPTTVRGPNLYATAAVRPKIREVGISNTTAIAVAVAIVRATAVGTKGAALTTGLPDRPDSHRCRRPSRTRTPLTRPSARPSATRPSGRRSGPA